MGFMVIVDVGFSSLYLLITWLLYPGPTSSGILACCRILGWIEVSIVELWWGESGVESIIAGGGKTMLVDGFLVGGRILIQLSAEHRETRTNKIMLGVCLLDEDMDHSRLLILHQCRSIWLWRAPGVGSKRRCHQQWKHYDRRSCLWRRPETEWPAKSDMSSHSNHSFNCRTPTSASVSNGTR